MDTADPIPPHPPAGDTDLVHLRGVDARSLKEARTILEFSSSMCKRLNMKQSPWFRLFDTIMSNPRARREKDRKMSMVQFGNSLSKPGADSLGQIIKVGFDMEMNAEGMRRLCEEMDGAKEAVQKSYNELANLSNVLVPQLTRLVKELRDYRMVAETEISRTITVMKEASRYLAGDSQKTGLQQLQEFTKTVSALNDLIRAGALDRIVKTLSKEGADEPNEG